MKTVCNYRCVITDCLSVRKAGRSQIQAASPSLTAAENATKKRSLVIHETKGSLVDVTFALSKTKSEVWEYFGYYTNSSSTK